MSAPLKLAQRPENKTVSHAFHGRHQAPTAQPDADFHLIGATVPYARNVEIFGEGEPAEYVYKVIEGAIRTYNILDDGRRQIGAFYLPGDVFGLETGTIHRYSAEAIVNSQVIVVKRSKLLDLANREARVARNLWTLTAQELQHSRDLISTLGKKSAVQRVVSFLLEMDERSAARDLIRLPMSRQDIADYLGLTLETVSRTFTHLEHQDAIELAGARSVILRNRSTLRNLNA